MNYADTLDIRTLASDWRELGDPESGEMSQDEQANYTEESQRYIALCGELGCDPNPDALEDYGDSYEPTLIRASDFQLYAQELAEDIGAIPVDLPWPIRCIDWEYAARELAYDYSVVRYEGTDYYIRSC
jgi:antirestriction protein